MSVSNYTPDKCRYYIGKLEDVVYLVSEDALKDIKIDNGNAFVASVSESPLSIKCYSLKLAEEESFDERYKFTHTVTFSVNGYMNKDNFNDKYYVILKDVEGTYWLVNPLFPSKVTYNYKLGYNENHTDFTLATASNHPVLRLNEFNVDDVHECEAYWYDGIAELKLNEKKYSAHIDNHIKYTNASGFKDVDFNDRTCVVTEEFDGENVRHQIDFNIMLSQYKNDWHYSLLEFKDNTYAAVFKTLNEKYGLCGFSMGLQPSFTIDADSESMSNTIKITLKDAHTDGLTLDFYDSVDYEYLSAKTWVYTADYGGYECIGEGTARYILKKEVDAFDNETGNYMVLDGYESYFQESSWPVFHIAGTFETTETFSNMECSSSDCTLNASFPSQIEFYEMECQNFYVECDTNWKITPSKDYITVNPSSGYGHTAYDVVVCNTIQPTDTADTSTLTIEYCSTSSTVNVVVVQDTNACLPQGSRYNVPANGQTLTIPTRCCVESVRETAGFGVSTVVLSNSIQATIPQNNTGLNRQSVLLVVYCDGTSGNIRINQSNVFEEWRAEGDYFCINRNKTQREYLWTGSTPSSYTKTDRYRDTIIEEDSYDCYGTDEWNYRKYVLVDNDWFCNDGNKYGLLRMYVSMDNINWRPTEIYKMGALIEEHSTDCCWDDKWNNYPYTKYEIVSGYICNDGNKYEKLLRYFSMDNVTWESSICIFKIGELIEANSLDCGYIDGGALPIYRWTRTDDVFCVYNEDKGDKLYMEMFDGNTFNLFCDTSTTIYDSDIIRDYRRFYVYYAEVGNCVTEIGELYTPSYSDQGGVFSYYENLKDIILPNTITLIGDKTFRYCVAITGVTIPNNVTTIGKEAFYTCSSLSNITIPDSVTSIGNSVFVNCTSLTSCTIGSGITTISATMFAGSSLQNIVIPNNVTEIGNRAFGECSSLTGITFSNSLTRIGTSAFTECISLKNITIPNSVTDIGENDTFRDCYSLTGLTIGSGITTICESAFKRCISLSSITIPDSVTTIGISAFTDCSGLTSVIIGSGLERIYNYAFYNCVNLTSITVNAIYPPVLYSNTIFQNTNISHIYVPSESVDEYKSSDTWSRYRDLIQPIS